MTVNRTFVPDPPPAEHAQAPPTHAHSNLPADEGVWAAARASFAAGCSTPVVAERHGLNERTVRRRAAAEDWASLRRRLRHPSAALFAGEPASAESEMERDPELAPFVAAHTYEVGELLLNPQPERLSRFAFRRCAEAAASGAAAEALGWMRLVQAVDRVHEQLERAGRPFSAADYMRAQYANSLRERFEEAVFADETDEAGDGPDVGAPSGPG